MTGRTRAAPASERAVAGCRRDVGAWSGTNWQEVRHRQLDVRRPLGPADVDVTTAAVNGQTHFNHKGCAVCHNGARFTDSSATTFFRHNIGTQTTQSGQRLGGTLDGIDTPTLRAVWSTPPYLHRGQAAFLEDVFTTAHAADGTAHARFRELTVAQQDELIRFLMEVE